MNRIEVELFPNVANRNSHNKQSIDRLIKWATTNEKLKLNTQGYLSFLRENPQATKQEKSRKKAQSFPAVTFGGTFSGTGHAHEINTMSGLIVLDLDHLFECGFNLQDVRNILSSDKYTYLLFTSPSGDGFKVVIKHNLGNPNEWKYLYQNLETYYLETFNIKTDTSGKDICRMCFIPFISDLYKNDNSETWQYEHKEEVKQHVEINKTINTNENSTDNPDIYKECFYISAYLFENKINVTDEYSDWILYGYSLCELGEQGREIYHNISCISEKYIYESCNKQFDYMLQNYDSNLTGIDFFLSNTKQAIVSHLLFTKYNYSN